MPDTIPASGTKAAVAYWAKRTRASLRDAQLMMGQGEWVLAMDLSEQAAGEAAEHAQAMQAAAEELSAR